MLIAQFFAMAVPSYAYETDAGTAAITDDAVIDSSKPTTNIDTSTNGTTSGLFSINSSGTTKKYAYFKFNLAGVNNPSYKFILNLGAKMGSSNTNVDVSVLGVEDTAWSEKTLTWNNASVIDPAQATPIGKFTVNTPNGSPPVAYSVDVTEYVRGHMADGSVTFMVGDIAAKSISFNLYSKEATGSNPKPSLIAKKVIDTSNDVTPPTWPAGSMLSAVNMGMDFITLKWPQATDDIGVTQYRVYQNNELLATVTEGTSYNVTGLTAGTAYAFRVEAADSAGNSSSNGPASTKSTLSSPITALGVDGVTASSNDGNIEIGTLDNNLYTRWSASGDGQWIMFDLGATQRVGYLGIAFYKGDVRSTQLDIQTSEDAVNWVTRFTGTTPYRTTAMQAFDIPDTEARYVRLVGHGNSDGSTFFSLTEVHVYAPFSAGDTPVATIPYFIPGPPPGTVPFTQPGMTNADGSAHPLHTPNPVTGQTMNVLHYGADPADNSQDDTAAIQAAIQAAKPGDEVYLPNGTYNLITSPDGVINISLKSGINLRGESQTGTILKTGLNKVRNSTALKAAAQNNVAISNMTLTSSWNGTYSTDTRANNPDGGGPDSQIIIANAGDTPSYNVTIDHVTIEKYGRMGIRIDNSHDVVVRDSLFRNAADVGPGGAGYGVAIQGMPKVDRLGFANDTIWNLAENNTFEGPYLRHGALIQNVAHNNVIRNNVFRRSQLDAIDLHGELEYLNEIHGNVISDIYTGGGVGLGNTGGTAPSNHSASGPKNYIHDNHIVNARDGISITMGTPDTIIERNLIENTVLAGGTGIDVMNAPRTIIRGNTIRNSTGDNFWAILLEHDFGDRNAGNIGQGDPQDIQILDNQIVGNTGGIQVQAGTGIILRGNTVSHNGVNYEKSDTAQIAEGWPSGNNDLNGLRFTSDNGASLPGLTPVFDPAVTQYQLTVHGASAQIQVTPTTADTQATVKVNGAAVTSGSASNPIELVPGVNPIEIVVISEQGTSKTYGITVSLDVPPTATVSYNITSPTHQDVTATIEPSEPITVTNNNGSFSHVFSENGSFTFEFVDAGGNRGSATAVVSNIDKRVPTLNITVDKPVLGPPNHQMIPIEVELQADGTGSGIASLVLTSITSNEPDNGTGDGDTTGDIQDADFGEYDTSFSLRAERSGKGTGRIYTIIYTITDEAGNIGNATAQVTVPN
ncbi:right-handed parallel beta-helix repeat-containing protein [Paenibacillus sp. HJGM_3]